MAKTSTNNKTKPNSEIEKLPTVPEAIEETFNETVSPKDETFDFDLPPHLEEDSPFHKLNQFSQITGIAPEALVDIILKDALGNGDKIKLLNALLKEQEEKVKRQQIQVLEKAKRQKEYEAKKLALAATAVFNGITP